jgi:3-polyprenyl-4-hydroxybenzoate decarboxylase
MAVRDVESFVTGLKDGSLHFGNHWSLSEATWSPSPEQSDRHVRLTGTIRQDQVDIFSTFQCLFAHPWEAEIVFSGNIALSSLVDLEEGITHDLSHQEYGLPI